MSRLTKEAAIAIFQIPPETPPIAEKLAAGVKRAFFTTRTLYHLPPSTFFTDSDMPDHVKQSSNSLDGILDKEKTPWNSKAVRPVYRNGVLAEIQCFWSTDERPPLVSEGPPLRKRRFLDLSQVVRADAAIVYPLDDDEDYRRTPRRITVHNLAVGPFVPVSQYQRAELPLIVSSVVFRAHPELILGQGGKYRAIGEIPTELCATVSLQMTADLLERIQRERRKLREEEVIRRTAERLRLFREIGPHNSFLSKGNQRRIDENFAATDRWIEALRGQVSEFQGSNEELSQTTTVQWQNFLYTPKVSPNGAHSKVIKLVS